MGQGFNPVKDILNIKLQQVCQLSVSEIFKNKHCQAIVSLANEVEMA